MVKAILFDLDDTLYNEKTYVVSGFRAVARDLESEIGMPCDRLVEEMMSILEADGRGRVFDLVLQRHGTHRKERIMELVELYRYHQPDIQPYPDVLPVLEELQRSGYLLGLITNGFHVMQKKKVSALGVAQHMDTLVYPDELGSDRWKPHPAGFLQGIDEIDVSPENTIYIGNDPVKDVEASREVGMTPVQICRPKLNVKKCQKAKYHIKSTIEVKKVLKNVNQIF
jgi:putative hydrolase of the HAD superfamily